MHSWVLESQTLQKILIAPRDTETIYFSSEVNNLFGIPDIVITQVDGCKLRSTYAIELKLSNWRRALEQAFRYRSFADYSYVILDNSRIRPAVKSLFEFERKNVGLIGLDDSGEIFEYYIPEFRKPYSEQFSQKISEMVFQSDIFTELEFDFAI
jgi:hypothetical protein